MATVSGPGIATDSVQSYFGMRTISVVDLPGTHYPYVAINGKPVYLQLALEGGPGGPPFHFRKAARLPISGSRAGCTGISVVGRFGV